MVTAATPTSTEPIALTSLMIREIAQIQLKEMEFVKAKNRLMNVYTFENRSKITTRYIRDPRKLKEKMRKFLPAVNVVPASMKDGGSDSFGKKVERLRNGGVPDWLGKDPPTAANN